MAHEHSHDHHKPVALTDVNNAFIIGILLNLAFVVVEVVAGFWVHSLSLLSDAGHNLADVGTLALSLLAFKLMKVRSNERYTYGYRKTSIIVALFNGMLLMVSIGAIVYEAVHRLLQPEPLPGKTIALVAGIGIFVNGLTALLFLRNKDKDINIKSAYLHLLSDAAVSLALVIGGIIIWYTNWFWLDSALSIVVAIVIFLSSWGLMKDSLRLSLDGVPSDIDIAELKSIALKVAGVKDFHHIHVWAISTTENAMTAHMVIKQQITVEEEQKIKKELKHLFLHEEIHHITIETEWENERCDEKQCDPE
jgi:cobalt-zinc-cadmium efflux system protein